VRRTFGRRMPTFHRFFGQRAAPYAACLADHCFNQVS
jgi:hypothetical protein